MLLFSTIIIHYCSFLFIALKHSFIAGAERWPLLPPLRPRSLPLFRKAKRQWRCVLLLFGDGAWRLLRCSEASISHPSVSERSECGPISSSLAGMERGHCCSPPRPRYLPPVTRRSASGLGSSSVAGNGDWLLLFSLAVVHPLPSVAKHKAAVA